MRSAGPRAAVCRAAASRAAARASSSRCGCALLRLLRVARALAWCRSAL
jgi:hypothetical protein